MAAGRKPHPTHLKVIKGNPGRRPLNEDEPEVTSGIPKVPRDLSDRAKKEWKLLAKLLDDMGVLTVGDGYALGRMCEIYVTIIECQEVIEEQGRTVESVTQTGSICVKGRPEVGMLSTAEKQFQSYLQDFGLTPSARSRLKVNGSGKKKKDPLDKYFG